MKPKPDADGRVTLTCPECGETFTRYASQARWRGARWCSISCRRVGEKPKPRTCRQCGESFTASNPGSVGTGKFCGRQCWRAWNEERNRRQVALICSSCGRSFERVAAWARKNSGRSYCSRECQGRGRIRPGSTSHRGPGWRKLAETIRERDGRRCVRCQAPEASRRHAVDHIVPWLVLAATPGIANEPANLATLCGSCHGVKTTVTEPRLARGDFLALLEFYGAEAMAAASERMARADALAAELGMVIR